MCDTSVFGPVKDKWIEAIQRYRKENNYKIVEEVAFVKVLKNMNDVAIKKETIINGFRMTGIFPFDKQNVDYSRCIEEQPQPEVENEENPEAHIESEEEHTNNINAFQNDVDDVG